MTAGGVRDAPPLADQRHLTAAASNLLTVEVEQAYGNCPQYIQQRLLQPSRTGP